MHRIRIVMFIAVIAFGACGLRSFPLYAGGEEETFDLTIAVDAEAPSITLSWPAATSTGYIYRRTPGTRYWFAQIASIQVDDTSFVDTNVVAGTNYEYRVNHSGKYAYVVSGIATPLEEARGKLVLLVDQTMAGACSNGLARLKQDLVGDGWQVLRHDVARDIDDDATAHQATGIHAIIKADYDADPDHVKAVLLFGHVPIPYSGNNNPDGHGSRAMPADGYYGDMDGVWTDTSVNTTNWTGIRNDNVPGDGKFDQTTWPNDIDLMVGRVDVWNMSSFSLSEAQLLQQYLNKAHAWRHGRISVPNRAIIKESRDWNWGPWNNARVLWGGNVHTNTSWFPYLYNEDFIYAYGGNTGGYTGVGGVGNTSDMTKGTIRAIFMFEGGSYSVDWAYPNGFMRSFVAASGHSLCGAWSEFPGWYLHHMGMGYPLGFSARVMQNCPYNDYKEFYANDCTRAVHHVLQGDPTVRLHPFAPPSCVVASVQTIDSASIAWTASRAEDILGYHLYRAPTLDDPFVRLNGSLVTNFTYTDATPRTGDVVYMVRAVRLETTAVGSYYNASQGVFAPLDLDGTSNQPPAAIAQIVTIAEDVPAPITLEGTDPNGDALAYLLSRAPSHGLVSGIGSNITYTPYLDYTGVDDFTFVVNDGWQDSITATVTIGIAYCRLDVATTGSGTISGATSGWYQTDAAFSISSQPSLYFYTEWQGDTGGCLVAGTTLTGQMDRVRNITVAFVEQVTARDTPYWWLAGFGWTNDFDAAETNDSDGDGMATWEEYVAHTVPTSSASLFMLTDVTLSGATSNVIVSWSSRPDRRYDLLWSTNLLQAMTPLATGLLPTPPQNVYTTEQYRAAANYGVRVYLAPK